MKNDAKSARGCAKQFPDRREMRVALATSAEEARLKRALPRTQNRLGT